MSACSPSGRLLKSQVVVPMPTPSGTQMLPVSTFTSDGSVAGGTLIAVQYASDENSVLLHEPQAAADGDGLGDAQVMAPTKPRPADIARGSRLSAATAAAAGDAGCWQEGYSFNGLQIYTGYYGYEARITSMPHGDADRAAITKGHHAWNNTVNPCGFPDVTNIVAAYIGPTSLGVHTYWDGHNVVDFGNPAAVGCVVPAGFFVLACTLGQTFEGVYFSDIDQRYTNQQGSLFSISATPPYNKVDLWSVASHESGHAVGLSHAAGGSFLTMYPTTGFGQLRERDLGLGDVRGFQCRYGVIAAGC